METIEHIDGKDVIDRYEIEENSIKIFYCDEHVEVIPYSKKKEQEILNEQLNQMKISINRFEGFDFEENIKGVKRNFAFNAIKGTLKIGAFGILVLSWSFNKEMMSDLDVLMTIIGGGLLSKIANYDINTLKYIKEEIQELKALRETIKTDKLYINNIELFEKPIEIVNLNQEVQVVKVNPNNIDDFDFNALNDAIEKQKVKSQKIITKNI